MRQRISSAVRPGREGNRAGADTSERILEAAELLFSSRGFAETSLRDVTERADANIAGVNYHFGSKEGLYAAVLDRQFGPVLAARLSGLDALEARERGGGTAVSVTELLASWLDPLLEAVFRADGRGRLILDLELQAARSMERAEITDWPVPFVEYRQRFRSAVVRAAAPLAADVASWRTEFICSCVLPTLRSGDELAIVSGGKCDTKDREGFRSAWIAAGVALLGQVED